jgi:4-hydroxy-2-oxoheptanedioate aldolase
MDDTQAGRATRFLSVLLPQLQSSATAEKDPLPAGGNWGEHYNFYRPSTDVPLYNTCKQKLLDGEKVFSCPIDRMNVEGYLEVRKHYDFVFFEMQHSTMTYREIEEMIKAGSLTGEAGAIPFIRMHSPATEHVFQQCSDIGALGFIVPTVDTPAQALEAAKWARFPPVARRSTGVGQAARVWDKFTGGKGYARTYNDNVVLVVMLETPVGIANAYEIASVPGVDVVLVGNYECVPVCSRAARRSCSDNACATAACSSLVECKQAPRDLPPC